MLTVPSELALTESRSMRAASMNRTDVLGKVKTLALLPGDVYASAEIVSAWFEIDTETLKKLVQRHRQELTENELRVLRGEELRRFVGDNVSLTNEFDPKTRNLTIFTRRTMLNAAMLLAGSKVAKSVRTYLLDGEATLTPTARLQIIEEAELQMRVLKAADGIIDRAWLELKARHVAARALGEEAESDPLDRPLYVPDFLKAKGLKKSQITSVQSWFGRRVAALVELETVNRPDRTVRNPQTGERHPWAARTVVRFRPGQAFAAIIRGDRSLPAGRSAAKKSAKGSVTAGAR